MCLCLQGIGIDLLPRPGWCPQGCAHSRWTSARRCCRFCHRLSHVRCRYPGFRPAPSPALPEHAGPLLKDESWRFPAEVHSLREKPILLSKDAVNEHGASVPSQRLSTGELAFLAENVPPLGSASFHLSAAAPHVPVKRVTVLDGILDNGIVRAKVDGKSGNIVELTSNESARNLVETSRDEAINQYLFLEGKDTSKESTSGPVRIA